MKRASVVTGLAVAVVLALGAAPAVAKGKAKAVAKGTRITAADVQMCNGTSGSTPPEQIEACTKIINSGQIKSGHEGDYYATRGAAFFALHGFAQAKADFDKALSLLQRPEYYFQRSLVLIALHDVDGGKADLAQVIKLRPDFAPGYFMRGMVALKADDYAEAKSYFDQALQRLPTYHQALFARGVAKKKSGDESGGDRDIKDARALSQHADEDMKKLGVTAD